MTRSPRPRRRLPSRGFAVALVSLIVLATAAGPAAAHPLGNLSVNTFSRLVILPDAITVDVIVDAAEIPTLQAFPRVNQLRGDVADGERLAYRRSRCAEINDSAALRIAGEAVALDVAETALTFKEGSAALHTSRLTCTLQTARSASVIGAEIDYTLGANSDRVGWREIIAVGSGVALKSSDVPSESISSALTTYPNDLLRSPPNQTHARVVAGEQTAGTQVPAAPGAGSAGPAPRGLDAFTSAFTDLVARQDLSAGFAVLAFVAAMALGALHAFAPGHGKTVMAAYLIGREGSFRQAAIVGLSVTATHTLGVLVLGVVLTGAGLASPERVYPWLGTASGLLLAGIGINLLFAQRAQRTARASLTSGHAEGHDHGHDHASSHEPAVAQHHRHGLFSHAHVPGARNVRGLIAVGFAGGLVPSPSALLVLLGGITLGRAWFGVVLVLAYGLGMAAALVATGLLLVSARDAVDRALARRAGSAGRFRLVALVGQRLPLATASIVVVVGLSIAARSALQI